MGTRELLEACLAEIEQFDRHEDVPRVLHAIDAAFDVCETFAEQERLVGTLIAMADGYFFSFVQVTHRLWLQAQKWTGLERGRTLGAIAWYLAPSLGKWTYPLPREQIQTELEGAASSEIQTFLVQRQGELWRLISGDDPGVAMGAMLMLGTIQSLDGGDLELLLEASAAFEQPLPLATGLLAVGRAGQYCRASYGHDALAPLTTTLGVLVEHADVWVRTLAVGTLALLALPLPATATEALVSAIEARAPISRCLVPPGAFWKNHTSLQLACTILRFAGLARSERLERALASVHEGASKRDALAAREHLK